MAFLEGYYRMTEHRIRHLILVDEAGDLAGIVTETDFMRHLKLDAFLEPQRVEALMTPQPITLGPQATVAEALTLMHQHRISSIVVTGAGCPIGILSERDAVRLARQGLALNQIPLGGVMSRPVRIVSTETLAHEANVRMKEERIRHLAVVDSAGQLAGILTEHDMVKGLQGRYTEFLRRVIEHQGRELSEARQVLSETLVLEHILRGALDVALVAADRDRRVHYINPAAAALFGVERGAARGQSLEALHHLAGLDEAQLATGLAAVTGSAAGWLPFTHFGAAQSSLLLLAMVGIAALGVHPVITLATAGVWLAPLHPDPNLLAITLLMGWAIGVPANPLSGLHLILQGRYGIDGYAFLRWNTGYVLRCLGAAILLLHLYAALLGVA